MSRRHELLARVTKTTFRATSVAAKGAGFFAMWSILVPALILVQMSIRPSESDVASDDGGV